MDDLPEDTYNNEDNPFRFVLPDDRKMPFARGNYGIDMGSSYFGGEPGSPGKPVFEGMTWRQDGPKGEWWGNGIAGFNKSFSQKDIVNGLSTTVAVDELRAGILGVDSRGAWALGQVGCSATLSHGIYSDAGGPNCQRVSADDTVGCIAVARQAGRGALLKAGAPCCTYCGGAREASARSMHPGGGVNVLMADGSAHFVSNSVDLGVWHAIHSRLTREKISPDSFAGDGTKVPHGTGEESEHRPDLKVLGVAEKPPAPLTHPLKSIVNSIGMKFIEIPAGEFIMGLSDKKRTVWNGHLHPPHWVRITKPFHLGACEVTQGEYNRVMGTNPSWHSATGGAKLKGRDTKLFPVENVTWYDAVEFCKRLGELPAEVDANRTYRLPTEAEWEYACRAGSTAPGDGRNGGGIGVVGQNQPNPRGLYDMCGNVFEWCGDWYARDWYARSPRDDPQGPPTGQQRVARGSEWIFTGDHCQLDAHAMDPWLTHRFVGFRVVCCGGA